ncbi:unnamed protein product, partial [Lymnaea stagnalis]
MNRYVFPSVCLLGFSGNILSFYVLLRCKLKRPSDIFLFALTVSDCLYLLYPLDATKLLIYFGSGVASIGWAFPEKVAHALFVINLISETFANLGAYTTTTLAVAITVERCLAVFFPLKFKHLVTPKRAWITVLCVFLFWSPWCLNAAFLASFYYVRLNGASAVGLALPSPYYNRNVHVITVFDKFVFSALSYWIPVILVTTGSILVGVKVKTAHRKRRELASSSSAEALSRSMKRTTRTLLSVSMIFAVLYGYGSLADVIRSETVSSEDLLGGILLETRNLAFHINSSSNFLVYLLTNRKFRAILCESCRC